MAISLAKESQHPMLRKSPNESWQRICDYLLVDEGTNSCEITMIEMKSTLQNRTAAFEQLRRSLPLAKYLLSVCEVELRDEWYPRFRYVLIAEKRTNRLNKGPIRPISQIETEDYRGIKVSIRVGTRFNFPTLVA